MTRTLLACGSAAIALGCFSLDAEAATDRTFQSQSGIASHYSTASGSRTASGERLNNAALTAAHRTLPFGTKVRVTNQKNGRSVVVTINDRGPFIRGRVIDLTPAGARALGFSGLTRVALEVEPIEELQDKPLTRIAKDTNRPDKPQDKTTKPGKVAKAERTAEPQDKTFKLASVDGLPKLEDKTNTTGTVAGSERATEAQESSAKAAKPTKADKPAKREKTARAGLNWGFLRSIFSR